MQVHFSYQHGSSTPQLEKIIQDNVAKLDQLLVRFSPDLVHLHGLIEFGTNAQVSTCSVNLWLPTAQLHATEQGRDLGVALRACFDHLKEQVKKHKEVLRREGEWKRKRYKAEKENKKLEIGELHLDGRQQLREYLDQVLPQLRVFVERELRYQQMNGACDQSVEKDEIVNLVVERCLGDHKAFSGDPTPFHRLLKEAIQALNGSGEKGQRPGERSSESPASVSSPQQNAADPVDYYLSTLPPEKRQVYVLRALEGFEYDEAAQVLGRLPSEIEETFQSVSRKVSEALQATRRSHDEGHSSTPQIQ